MRSTALLTALVTVAACDRATAPSPEKDDAPAIEAKEVAAADGFGEPGRSVNAVAFWSHPGVNFESLVLAATDEGVDAYSIETGDKVASVAQGPVSELAVVYAGEGAAARGYAAAGRGAGYEFYAIDNETRAMAPVMVEMGAPGTGTFCAGRRDGGLALYEIGEGALASRQIDLREGGLALGDPAPLAEIDGILSCHVDDRTGAVITVSAGGAIRRVDPASGAAEGVAIADGAVDGSALILTKSPQEGAPGGAIAILDGGAATVRLFDLVDGRAIGAVRVKSTFDLDAVATATSIAAGYGNYGGVYRDGALAIVTAGDGAPVRLAPWNGVLDALGLPLGDSVDPRAPQAADEADDFLSIELKEP